MIGAVQPRRWDVGVRRSAALGVVLALGVLTSGCGQARSAAPPAPEFTPGSPPASAVTVPSTPPLVTPEEPELDAVEPDLDPVSAGDLEPSTEATVPDTPTLIERMTIVDDTGRATPNLSGWQVFDESISRRLIPADTSVSVAVMANGEIVHAAAFGERVAGTGEAVDPGDRFRVASISKTITSIVTQQLVEAGLLTLDEPIGQLLADYLHIPNPDPDVVDLTVRELLSHTAGFGKFQSVFFGGGASSYTDAARIGLSGSLGSGGSYSYSNMGFAVLTVLIEAVTGQAYEQVVTERLLEPLGITGMRMTGTHELGPDEVSHHPAAGRLYMEALGGAGSWNATPSDLVTILNSIDPKTDGWKALSPESMQAMRYRIETPARPAGYGLGIINYDGNAWGHTGTIENVHAMVLVNADGVTWAVTVSGETPSSTESLRSIVAAALASAFPA